MLRRIRSWIRRIKFRRRWERVRRRIRPVKIPGFGEIEVYRYDGNFALENISDEDLARAVRMRREIEAAVSKRNLERLRKYQKNINN